MTMIEDFVKEGIMRMIEHFTEQVAAKGGSVTLVEFGG